MEFQSCGTSWLPGVELWCRMESMMTALPVNTVSRELTAVLGLPADSAPGAQLLQQELLHEGEAALTGELFQVEGNKHHRVARLAPPVA